MSGLILLVLPVCTAWNLRLSFCFIQLGLKEAVLLHISVECACVVDVVWNLNISLRLAVGASDLSWSQLDRLFKSQLKSLRFFTLDRILICCILIPTTEKHVFLLIIKDSVEACPWSLVRLSCSILSRC